MDKMNILKKAMNLNNAPIAMVGGYGSGKIAAINTIAKELDYEVIAFTPEEYNQIEKNILEKKKVVLLIDEFYNFNNLYPILSIFQNQEFPSGQKIPEETIIVISMISKNFEDFDLPTKERLNIIKWS